MYRRRRFLKRKSLRRFGRRSRRLRVRSNPLKLGTTTHTHVTGDGVVGNDNQQAVRHVRVIGNNYDLQSLMTGATGVTTNNVAFCYDAFKAETDICNVNNFPITGCAILFKCRRDAASDPVTDADTFGINMGLTTSPNKCTVQYGFDFNAVKHELNSFWSVSAVSKFNLAAIVLARATITNEYAH